MKDFRHPAEVFRGLRDAFIDSIEPVKVLLQSLFHWLELKGEQFQTFIYFC